MHRILSIRISMCNRVRSRISICIITGIRRISTVSRSVSVRQIICMSLSMCSRIGIRLIISVRVSIRIGIRIGTQP